MESRKASLHEAKSSRLRLCLKEAAEAKGFTVTSLSAASHVGPATVIRLWNDPSANFLMSTLRKLAEALNMNPLHLFERRLGEEEPSVEQTFELDNS